MSLSTLSVAPILALLARPTATMTTLAAKPSLRNPQVRQGCIPNLARPSNLEAYLGQLIGEVNEVVCTHCGQRGAGVWIECVSVKGCF